MKTIKSHILSLSHNLPILHSSNVREALKKHFNFDKMKTQILLY